MSEDFSDFSHPDPRFPKVWAEHNLDAAIAAEGLDPAQAETHWGVNDAEFQALLAKGYTEAELTGAMRKAIEKRMGGAQS